jgi:hypothetical protein
VTLPWDELKPEPEPPPPPPPPNLPDVIIPSQPVQLDLGKILTDALAQVLRQRAPADSPPDRRTEMKKGAIASIIDTLLGWLPEKTQEKIQASRKAIVAGIGSLLAVLTFVSDKLGFLIPPQYAATIGAVIAFLTTVLTWSTPNALPPAEDSSGA